MTYTDRISGLATSTAIKTPVNAATTSNITLSGQQTIDTVALVSGDYVLVKNQTNAVDNGIWVVSTGAWTRREDFDGSRDIVKGTQVFVNGGSQANTQWYVAADATIGTDSITFSPLFGERLNRVRVIAGVGDSNLVGQGGEGSNVTVTSGKVLQWNGSALANANDPVGNVSGSYVFEDANTASWWPALGQAVHDATGDYVCVIPCGKGGSTQTAGADSGSGNWDTTGALLASAFTYIDAGIAALEAAGYEVVSTDFITALGTNDATWIATASSSTRKSTYKTATQNMLASIRSHYGATTRVGMIQVATNSTGSDYGYALARQAQEEIVRSAETNVTVGDVYTFFVFREGLDFVRRFRLGGVHYNSLGLEELGRKIAMNLLTSGAYDAIKVRDQHVIPQGRLTLTSGAAVMGGNVTGATTIYYTQHTGVTVPWYDGYTMQEMTFAGQIQLALSSNAAHTGYHQSGKVFDLFVALHNGVATLGTGPAWSTTTSRGTGAGTTELQIIQGLYFNAVDITFRYGSASGDTATVPAGMALYVGSFYATANGQTAMNFIPTAAGGGTNNFLGLWNAYNRVPYVAKCVDSTASWTYTTAAWRAANNSTSNRITYLDGLAQSHIRASAQCTVTNSATSVTGYVGIAQDGTTPSTSAATTMATATGLHTTNVFLPSGGLHYVQAVEYASGATVTYSTGSGAQQALTLSIEM